MDKSNCDGVIADLAQWIRKIYTQGNLVTMSKPSARAKSAQDILGRDRHTPMLVNLLGQITDCTGEQGETVRLSAIREALGLLDRQFAQVEAVR